jgi:Domain of unknown function (DUF4345)
MENYMSEEKWIFGATAIGFAGFGIALLIFPNLIGLIGVKELKNSGLVEIRAMYGGLQLGLGLFFLLALNRPRWVRAGLVLQVCILGGLVIGRIFGLVVVNWQAKPLVYLILAAELILAILGTSALISYKKAKKKSEFEIRKT